MAKITYMPTEEIVVHQVLEYDNKSFFEEVTKQSLARQISLIPSVNWIDGVAFVVWPYAEADDIVREGVKGRMHIFAVLFTRIPYQTHFPVTLANQDIRVPLRKATNNPDFIDLVNFLKEFKPDPRVSVQVSS